MRVYENLRAVWWAQDRATAHRARKVRDRFRQLFGRQVISMGYENEWPAQSPDLTPLDFFMGIS